MQTSEQIVAALAAYTPLIPIDAPQKPFLRWAIQGPYEGSIPSVISRPYNLTHYIASLWLDGALYEIRFTFARDESKQLDAYEWSWNRILNKEDGTQGTDAGECVQECLFRTDLRVRIHHPRMMVIYHTLYEAEKALLTPAEQLISAIGLEEDS